jgi:hypothetical protein
MRSKTLRLPMVALSAALAATACLAQDTVRVKETGKPQVQVKPDVRFFKLEFVIKEVDGAKVMNSRAFSVVLSTAPGSTAFIRSGVRVQQGDSQHIEYNDVGVHIDCRNIRDVEDQLAANVSADITAAPQESASSAASTIMRHYQWSSDVLIPLKKPTVVFSSDSTTSKNQMQLELTATPIP